MTDSVFLNYKRKLHYIHADSSVGNISSRAHGSLLLSSKIRIKNDSEMNMVFNNTQLEKYISHHTTSRMAVERLIDRNVSAGILVSSPQTFSAHHW